MIVQLLLFILMPLPPPPPPLLPPSLSLSMLLLSVEIKKCMYLAVFEVSWSSKLNLEHSYCLIFIQLVVPSLYVTQQFPNPLL